MLKALRSILKWFGIGLLALATLYTVLVAIGSIAVSREKAALRADGRPMTIEEIIPPEIPDEDNAALRYNAAFEAIKEQPPLKLEGDKPPVRTPQPTGGAAGTTKTEIVPPFIISATTEPPPPDTLLSQLCRIACEVIREPSNAQATKNFGILLGNPDVVKFLAAANDASKLPGYRQNIDYNAGPSAKIPHIADNLALSRILRAQAVYLAQTGDFVAAWQTIERSLKFSETLRKEPILTSQWVRNSQIMLVVDAIKKVAALSPPDSTISENLSKQLGALDLQSSLETAYDGERVFGADWVFRRLYLGFVVPWDYAASLRASREICRDVRKQRYGTGLVELNDYTAKVPSYCILTRLMFPGVQSAGRNSTYTFGEAEVTRLGLAALRYKQERGSFPPDLLALGAENIVDPFTGKAFVYRPEGNGFVIYSLGPDATDDNGDKFDHKKQKGDIVWRYAEKAR
jgi:hypothetical protein